MPILIQRAVLPEGWFPRGLVPHRVGSPEDWFPKGLLPKRNGFLEGWFPRGLVSQRFAPQRVFPRGMLTSELLPKCLIFYGLFPKGFHYDISGFHNTFI